MMAGIGKSTLLSEETWVTVPVLSILSILLPGPHYSLEEVSWSVWGGGQDIHPGLLDTKQESNVNITQNLQMLDTFKTF